MFLWSLLLPEKFSEQNLGRTIKSRSAHWKEKEKNQSDFIEKYEKGSTEAVKVISRLIRRIALRRKLCFFDALGTPA